MSESNLPPWSELVSAAMSRDASIRRDAALRATSRLEIGLQAVGLYDSNNDEKLLPTVRRVCKAANLPADSVVRCMLLRNEIAHDAARCPEISETTALVRECQEFLSALGRILLRHAEDDGKSPRPTTESQRLTPPVLKLFATYGVDVTDYNSMFFGIASLSETEFAGFVADCEGMRGWRDASGAQLKILWNDRIYAATHFRSVNILLDHLVPYDDDDEKYADPVLRDLLVFLGIREDANFNSPLEAMRGISARNWPWRTAFLMVAQRARPMLSQVLQVARHNAQVYPYRPTHYYPGRTRIGDVKALFALLGP